MVSPDTTSHAVKRPEQASEMCTAVPIEAMAAAGYQRPDALELLNWLAGKGSTQMRRGAPAPQFPWPLFFLLELTPAPVSSYFSEPTPSGSVAVNTCPQAPTRSFACGAGQRNRSSEYTAAATVPVRE
jgi:hypothetical protein